MSKGTYRRCEVYRCKRKVAEDDDMCPQHANEREARWLLNAVDTNPSMARMVMGIVDAKLQMYGLIGEEQ